MEEPNGLQVIYASVDNMTKILEECVRTGTPLLIEGISDKLDPSLEPVLSRNLYLKYTYYLTQFLLIKLAYNQMTEP